MRTLLVLFLQSILTIEYSLGQEKSQTIDSLFNAYEQNNKFGGTVLVAEQDSVIYQKAIGWENYDEGEKLKVTTSVPLASLTKSGTSMAIMILKQNGKLNYDDLVKKHIHDFPFNDVTIRQLLYHTAGFKRLENYTIQKGEVFDHHGILDYLIKNKPKLSFVPGTKFQYSNTGYAVLACIVESASGLSYSKFIENYIFNPLGMMNSFVIERSSKNRQRAFTYNEKWKMEERNLDSYTGAIGIYSTTIDLYKFDQALYTESLVPQNILMEGFENGKLNDNTEINYAFGWRHWKGNTNQLFNRGDWWGIATIMFRDIEKKQAIIILANKNCGLESSVLIEEIIKILNGKNNANCK